MARDTFDPVKAIREEISGLAAVRSSLKRREQAAEEAMGKAEQELNDVRKILGFVSIELERKSTVLRELQDAEKIDPVS